MITVWCWMTSDHSIIKFIEQKTCMIHIWCLRNTWERLNMNEPGLKCDYYKHLSKITLGFFGHSPSLGLDNWGSCESLANQSAAQKSKPPEIMNLSSTVPYQLSTYLAHRQNERFAAKCTKSPDQLKCSQFSSGGSPVQSPPGGRNNQSALVPGLGWSPVSLEWST